MKAFPFILIQKIQQNKGQSSNGVDGFCLLSKLGFRTLELQSGWISEGNLKNQKLEDKWAASAPFIHSFRPLLVDPDIKEDHPHSKPNPLPSALIWMALFNLILDQRLTSSPPPFSCSFCTDITDTPSSPRCCPPLRQFFRLSAWDRIYSPHLKSTLSQGQNWEIDESNLCRIPKLLLPRVAASNWWELQQQSDSFLHHSVSQNGLRFN